MEATTFHSTKRHQFDDIKLIESKPLSISLIWLWKNIVSSLLWIVKLFKWTITLLADIFFVWTPEILGHAWRLYGEGVFALCAGALLGVLLVYGMLFC